MKTMKRCPFKLIAFLSLSVLLSTAYAAEKEIQKTFTWKYNISKDGKVTMDNYNCNLVIHTRDKGETELQLKIEADTRSDEDAAILEKYLQELVFSTSPSSVSFRSRFWENRSSLMNRTTMKLEGGKSVTLNSFEMTAEMWIPAGCMFVLNSKYSRINMEDFAGQLVLNLYNDNFYGGSVVSNAEITDKYGTIEFRDMKDIKANLYNSKLSAGNTGDLNIESKYSRVNLASCGKISSISYNDKYEIPKTGDVTFTSKYSDLKTESSGNIALDMYNGTVIMKEIRDVKITSKYTEYQFYTTGRCTISTSYNDKFTCGRLTSLTINESKYLTFRIGYLEESVEDRNCYNDSFTIAETGKDFSGLSLNGKYVTASVTLHGSTSYHLKANIKYADLNIDESSLKPIVKIIDGSDVKYDAIKGTESEGMPVIDLNGYQMTLNIPELN
ncbi:MAG: hypothetical protein V1903_13905 [Bacteroidota bacterium]